MPFGLVLLDPVRSADPPIISGTAAVSASSAVSDAARVAISFGVAASFSFAAHRGGELLRRQLAAHAALEFGAAGRRSAASRSFQALVRGLARLPGVAPQRKRHPRECRRRAPASRSRSRAPLISSAPSGEPWLFSVPALLGAPKPMVVRQAISDGRVGGLRRGDAPWRSPRGRARRRGSPPSRQPRNASPGRPNRTATAARRWRCRCRRTAPSAC